MKLIRYIFLFISATVAAPLQLHGQQQFFVNTDTIDIGDVSIVSRSVNGAKGYRITSLTEAMLSDFKGSSLSELLEKSSTLLVKNYGSGGLATSSFRGMGASHTRVFWAGIPVNPPASGQVDFSLVPVTFSGTVEIYHGASPTGDGSGGPGGTISLNSVPDWNSGTSLFFRQGAGSFGYLSDDLSIITGSGLWQLFTNSYIRRADNDFTYTDNVSSSVNETETRTNSSFIMKGISQELFLKKGNSIISGRYWLNFSDRELPGPVISGENPGEKQKDKQLRVTASVRNYSTPVILDFRGAYMSDYLEYINPQAGIESNTRSSTLYFFGSGRFNVSSRSYLDISFSEKLSAVNSENHDGKN
ncbi:MAG: Plug domain-containing protein, partial [Bacteroidia bacterium]